MARNNVPIPLEPWTKHSDDPWARLALSTILKMVGVNEKQALSNAMQKAEELRRDNTGDHERTPEQREHWRQIRRAIDDYHRSNGKDYATALRLVQSHQLSEYERHELEAGMRMPPIAFAVCGLPAEDVLQVYEKATDQEKRDLLRYQHQSFERVIEKRMEAAARAQFEDRTNDANEQRQEAQRLVREFQKVSEEKPQAAAAR